MADEVVEEIVTKGAADAEAATAAADVAAETLSATASASASATAAHTAGAAVASAGGPSAAPKGKKEKESFLKNIVDSAMGLVSGDDGAAGADAAAEPTRTIYLPSLKRFCDMAAEKAVALGLALSYESEQKRIRVGLPGPMLAPEGQPHPWVDAVPYYNAYANCDPDDEESKAFVFRELLLLCQAKVSPLGNLDDVRPLLRARLRLGSQLALFDLQCEIKGDEAIDIPRRVVADSPQLVAELCVDRGDTIAMVTGAHLRAWGRAFDGLLTEVLAGLAVASTPGKWRRMPDANGCWLGQFRDGFDATRMVCPSVIAAVPVVGRHVVMVPHAEVLLVAGSDEPRAIRAMLDTVLSLFGKVAEPICGMWIASGDAWKPWTPSATAEPALATMVKNLAARGLGQQYHSQKKLLDALHEKRESKIMVPSSTLMQHPQTGDVLSHCIWQMGMENLLPQTDIVMLCTPENLARPIVGQASFDALMAEMGDAVVRKPTVPPRWRCAKGVFPTPEQIVRLSGDGFEAPEIKDAGIKLQTMIAEAHRKRERDELQEKLL